MLLTLQWRARLDYATKFWLPVRRRQILERDDAPIYKRHCFVRNRDRRWDVGIIERVVERIAKEDEMAAMMKTGDAHAEPKSGIKSRAVAVVRIVGGAVRRIAILDVNPGLGGAAAHFAGRFLLRRTPRQPDRTRGHARANLSLAHQRLVPRRKAIENVRVLRNSILEGFAAR